MAKICFFVSHLGARNRTRTSEWWSNS